VTTVLAVSEVPLDSWAASPARMVEFGGDGPYSTFPKPGATSLDELSSRKINLEMAGSGPKLLAYAPEPVRISRPVLRSYAGNFKPTHESFYGVAYVNENGRIGFKLKPFAFPIGTTIVREKLRKLNATPDRLVVMIKHERDFNPRANGWEFLTVSGDGSKIIKRENDGACLKCHMAAADKDFVFPEDGRYR